MLLVEGKVMLENQPEIIVAHSLYKWLSFTQNWIYNQIQYLPNNVENHVVVCRELENLDRFYLDNIHCLADNKFWRGLSERIDKINSGRKTNRQNSSVGLSKRVGKPNTLAKRIRVVGKTFLHRLGHYPCSRFLQHITQKHSVDILHSHFGYIAWDNMKVAKHVGLRHVVTFYGQDVNQLPTTNPVWLDRYADLFTHIDAVLCEGPFMAQAIEKLGCPSEKIKVHHLGIEVDAIPFCPRQWQPNEPLKILLAASFREKKGIPYAINALGQIQKEIPLEITIIGDATGENHSKLEKKRILEAIDEAGLKSTVRLLGFQPHDVLLSEAQQHHIFMSPSVTASDGDTEGGAPVTILEMLASGMLFVGTNHCDIPNVVPKELRDLLANERDEAGLVDAIRWLVANYEDWDRLINAGKKHVLDHFDTSKQGQQLGKIYQQLLNA